MSDVNKSPSSEKSNQARRMVPLRYVLMPIAIILSAIILFVAIAALAPKPAKKPIIIKAPLVEVIDIERKDITFSVRSQGSVIPRTETSMISEVSGMIVEVSNKFQVGGYFKKGEQLLAIDDITYQVALVQAQSKLGSAEASLIEEKARAKQAKDEWMLSGKPLEHAPVLALRIPQQQKAEADVLAAKADVKAAEIKLERTKIIAPFDALVKSKSVDIGQYVSTGTILAVAFAIDYAEVRLPIKQKDVDFLNLPRINKAAEKTSKIELFYKIAGKTHQWQSRLTRYEGVVDSASRVHYVIAQIDDPYAISLTSKHNEIHIGTFVNARISGKVLKNIVAIPRGAVYGANTLYLIDQENHLQVFTVDLVRSDAEHVYTMAEFPSNTRVITTKLVAPVEGMRLRVSGEASENDEITNKDKAQQDTTEQGEH